MALRHEVGLESWDEPHQGVAAADQRPSPGVPPSPSSPLGPRGSYHGRHSGPPGRDREVTAGPVIATEPAVGEQPPAPSDGAGSRGKVQQLFRRLGWGLGDQAVSSLTNFAVSLYVARELGAVQYGAFGLAYVTYSFALNASRGLATDPFMVRFSAAEESVWRRAVRSATGTATSVGLVTGAGVLLTALLLAGTARSAFLALGLTLPGLMLQDSWRYAFFAAGRGVQAFLNDCVWALAMAPALIVLKLTHHGNVFWFVFAWGAAAWVAAAVGPLQARVMPRLSDSWEWVSRHRDLGPRYLAENTSNSGASQLRIYAVGGIVGLAAVGYVQAASTLMGPFLVIFMGISLVTVPEAARVLRRAPRHLRLYCLAVSSGLSLAGLAWGIILLVALPRGLGHWLLPSLWRGTYPLIIPLTISVLGSTATAGAQSGLRALGAAKRSLRAMVIGSVAYLGLGVAGAIQGGALGTVRGVAIATWIGAAVYWWQLRAGLRDSELVPADGQLLARKPASPAASEPASQPAGRHREAAAAMAAKNAALQAIVQQNAAARHAAQNGTAQNGTAQNGASQNGAWPAPPARPPTARNVAPRNAGPTSLRTGESEGA
jgi:O-antigen/teichoic acid export membrane protein